MLERVDGDEIRLNVGYEWPIRLASAAPGGDQVVVLDHTQAVDAVAGLNQSLLVFSITREPDPAGGEGVRRLELSEDVEAVETRNRDERIAVVADRLRHLPEQGSLIGRDMDQRCPGEGKSDA